MIKKVIALIAMMALTAAAEDIAVFGTTKPLKIGSTPTADIITGAAVATNTAKASFECRDIIVDPLPENSVQCGVCLSVLEHVFHLERFAESMAQSLAPEGKMYVGVPNDGGFAWGCMRQAAHYVYSAKFGVDYRSVMARVHCNQVWTIENVLRKFFDIRKVSRFPFGAGGIHLNLFSLYEVRRHK